MNRTRPRDAGLAGDLARLWTDARRLLPPAARLAVRLDALRAAPPELWPADDELARALADPPPGEPAAVWGWLQACGAGPGWRPLPAAADPPAGAVADADRLHERFRRRQAEPAVARRLLEQELLLRGPLAEDWAFHRARWLYRRLQLGPGGAPARREAALRARAAGILFHPDQLDDEPAGGWARLRPLLESLPPGRLAELAGHLLAGRPAELLAAPSVWARLRVWIGRLCGGGGLPLLELPAGALPGPLPQGEPRGPLPLVLHLDGAPPEGLARRLAELVRDGWQPLLVHGGPPLELAELNLVDALARPPEDAARRLLRAGVDPVLPLREFVRSAERRYIQEVIGLHGGVKTRACEALRITRQTLYSKLAREEG